MGTHSFLKQLAKISFHAKGAQPSPERFDPFLLFGAVLKWWRSDLWRIPIGPQDEQRRQTVEAIVTYLQTLSGKGPA
jgi:hypothetical protein